MIADHEHRHCVPGQCEDDYPDCPICGEPIDYCPGHGEVLDADEIGLEYISPAQQAFAERIIDVYSPEMDAEPVYEKEI